MNKLECISLALKGRENQMTNFALFYQNYITWQQLVVIKYTVSIVIQVED